MRGNITRRGKSSWRIKFDVERDASGKRRFHTVTMHGGRKKAEEELARLLNDAHRGTLVDQHRDSVGTYLRSWLDGQHDLAPSTVERYRDVLERQTIPYIGDIELQKLKPVHIRDWLVKLRQSGRRQLSAQSVTCAYRVLRAALNDAVRLEVLGRNVADAVPPPKTHESEVEILDADQIATALSVLKGNRIYPIVALAIATGMRRGELLALRWQDVDLERGVISVERSLDEAFRIRNRNLNTVGGPYRYRCLLWNCYVSTVRHS